MSVLALYRSDVSGVKSLKYLLITCHICLVGIQWVLKYKFIHCTHYVVIPGNSEKILNTPVT